MQVLSLPPDPQLLESMRAVGYTLPASLADLIDNSIDARARRVELNYSSHAPAHVALLDDGHGMGLDTLIEAMKLAGTGTAERSDSELGRFGLGLKTASLAHCRQLTVVSKRNNEVHALRWDLDHVASTGLWQVIQLDGEDIAGLPMADQLRDQESGTLVVWHELDQLLAQHGASEQEFDRAFMDVRSHLGLVFHRFLNGETGSFSLAINGGDVPAADPFLTAHRGTQASPAEIIRVDDQELNLQAFTLPYLSKISRAQRDAAHIDEGLRDTQGFYIYRNRRLVIWGTWFRIAPKKELGKLTRVKVDIPNTLDHLWQLDIKKAAATPPPQVKARLRELVPTMTRPSHRSITHRGFSPSDADSHVWRLVEEREGFRYELDPEHPLLADHASILPTHSRQAWLALLTHIADAAPFQDAYARLAGDTPWLKSPDMDEASAELLRAMWAHYPHDDMSAFFSMLERVHPFRDIPKPAMAKILETRDAQS